MAAPLPIASLYASLLAIVFLGLTFSVIGLRRSGKVAHGDGGNTALARRIRGHANFSELVPFALLLFAVAEVQSAASGLVLHVIGAALLAGRAAHAAAFTNDRLPAALHFRARTFGTAATTGCISVLAALLLKSALL